MGQGESSSPGEHDDSTVSLAINGTVHTVSNKTILRNSLNTFIREVACLKGTKAMCHEGGCGACIVAVETNGRLIAVNSCLVSVFLCDGWKITTVEGLGSRVKGYHTLQATLAEMNGSQCGFCSPGWVMNMYSLTKGKKMTMKEIENSFGGNICRCTGYRPILDAFKMFASDATPEMKNQIKDIEEAYSIQSCRNCPKNACSGTCKEMEIIHESSMPRSLQLDLEDSLKFYKVLTVDDIFDIFRKHPSSSYVINGGNTARGVYRLGKVQVYIDVNDVLDLHRLSKTNDALTLGANVTLSIAKDSFEKYMTHPGFEYLKEMAKHVDLVASVPVRNIGTIAGNLMIKNNHNEFPSDIFLILETARAEIHILDSPDSKKSMNLIEFLYLQMEKKLIYSIVLPSMSKDYVYKTYKIMPRAQNAHAIVNAGFLFKLDKDGKVLERPNVIFGGIDPDFLHASKTETFFSGKCIYDHQTLKQAFNVLKSELNPDHVLPDFTPEYRQLLSVGLLYKFILSISSSRVSPKLRSGGTLLERKLSSGKQDYDTNKNIWPINQPMPKIESIYQTSGEGEFINDIQIKHNEVFCALTLAEAPGKIYKIDYEAALNIDGVVAFYSAKNIPGKNLFINSGLSFESLEYDEILFADNEVQYAGQPYGMIVAESQNIAQYAASKVSLVYKATSKRKPLITVQDVINANDKSRIKKIIELPAKEAPGKDEKYKIKGSHVVGSQYHFSMEVQTCVCVPIEDGMDVFSATQWMDLTQASVASLLDVPTNTINIKVRRLGGAYGAKISRATQIACACALACHLLRRPARLVMSIEDNMRAIGKRVAAYMEYYVSVDEHGKIQRLNGSYYGNKGAAFNESHATSAINFFYNCYDEKKWNTIGYDVKTDLPCNTWCRSPGSVEGIGLIEHIMERIARVTGKDPLEVRINNMNQTDKEALLPMIENLKKSSNYEQRLGDVKKFNQENRWKKRGISLVTMKYSLSLVGQYYSMVSIYARDGTVSVSHAGIEMGQGLHTKMAQIVASAFNIDLKMVSVKPSNTLISPNSSVTGGSVGSDVCGFATLSACKIILKRLKPIRDTFEKEPTWQELILKAHTDGIDLHASDLYVAPSSDNSYPIYGATVSEVEVDMLTGQHLVHRVDILEDVGVSLSPKIDLGQIEGAFVMGIGLWTCEDLIYDPKTGGLTNYRTWNYKVPGAKDIPVDFRVSFRRNASNPLGILRSKATGEPPLCMSCSIPIAIRHALNSARADAGNTDLWYQMDAAVTTEKILLNSLTSINGMEL
ncbi:xanthine dehydrogenase-like [Copidosoma floridanum]|uniref:xanthine dehydrogenase-like n=1 Tax=Copidosoma floridanum TaxID=29053 RepID=UPI0006C98E4A|nr:xanthine dehydrogenase-like [Copidosoma floridanum]